MAVKKLVRIGDQKLITRSVEVNDIKHPEVQAMITDLIDSMRHYGGVGIAAPQIGYFQRILVLEVKDNPRYPDKFSVPLTVLINPEVEILTEEREAGWEGCLSVPGYRGLVPRFTYLRYRGYDQNGELIEAEARDFHARVIQHELDHLDGVLFPMRIEDMTQFGREDVLWEQMNGQPYPEELRAKMREHWS